MSAQVLYLTEPIDEVTIQNLAKFGEHAFVDVSKEEIDLGEDEDEKAKVRGQRPDGPPQRRAQQRLLLMDEQGLPGTVRATSVLCLGCETELRATQREPRMHGSSCHSFPPELPGLC